MSTITGKKALLTGGASGIGRLMGQLLLHKGLDTLVIWDIDKKNLEAVKQENEQQGYRVLTYALDISDTNAVISTAEDVLKECGVIDILINNAGIVVGKDFIEHSHEEINRTMEINTSALMHITKAFLPAMQNAGTGHIVNIASAAGLVGNPKMSVYVASKWAVTGWSDSLRLEMEMRKTNVWVTTVTPYYISTGMFAGVKSSVILPIVRPEKAASRIIAGIERNKLWVRMPGLVYLLPLVKGILPQRWFDKIVGGWMGIYKTMDEFTGRNPLL